MLTLENLCDVCLYLTHEKTIIFVFMLGYIFRSKPIFLNALGLLLFTMVYNHWLKSLWQIPLPTFLNKDGWAFPSGHMHTAFVFMGYIAWTLRKNLSVFITILCLLAGVGFSLVFKRYHSIEDVLAACAFGSLSIGVLTFTEKRMNPKPWLIPFSLLTLSVLIHGFLIHDPLETRHLFLAEGSLLGLVFSSYCFFVSTTPQEKPYKTLIITVMGLVALFFSSGILKRVFPDSLSIFLQYFFIASWLVGFPLCYGKKSPPKITV